MVTESFHGEKTFFLNWFFETFSVAKNIGLNSDQ